MTESKTPVTKKGKAVLDKLDDTKSKSWLKWVLLILAAVGSAIFLMAGDRRSSQMLRQRKKEIHTKQKDAKIDMVVNSREAIEQQEEKLEVVRKEYVAKSKKIEGLKTEDEVFAAWEEGAD